MRFFEAGISAGTPSTQHVRVLPRTTGPTSDPHSREAIRNGLNINGVEASDRPVRVLVVEDDKEIAHVLQRSLRLDGYEVKLAADGVQALDEAQ